MERLSILRALPDQSFTQRERPAGVLPLAQAVAGGELHQLLDRVEHVERRHAAAQRGHHVRQQLLAQLGKGGRALQLGRDLRRVRLHPALLLHRCGAAFQDVHGPRERASFVHGLGERHRLVIIALRDRLDGVLEGVQGHDDSPVGHESQCARQDKGEDDGDHERAGRLLDRGDRGLARLRGQRLVVMQPFGHHRADLPAERRHGGAQVPRRTLRVPERGESHGILGAGHPLARSLLHVRGELTIALARHETALVLPDQIVHLVSMLLEVLLQLAPRVGPLDEDVVASPGANLLEQLHDGRGNPEARDLRLRHEPAALLDLIETHLHEHAETDQRGERNGEQDEEPLGDRHRRAAPDSAERLPDAARREYTPEP